MTKTADVSSALDEFLAVRRAQVERALAQYAPTPPTAPAIVADAMRYSLMAGGKRLRPLLTLAAADAAARDAGLTSDAATTLALPAACAIEMIHTYSLVHDDLPAMDDDTRRRGRPTLHVVAGDGMAILAGDGLQAEAFGLLAREPPSLDPTIALRKLRVIAIVAEAAGAGGMVGGQAIDLAACRPGPARPRERLDSSAVEDMHARKTGALIRAAAVSGAVIAGASDRTIAAIQGFASAIGLAFQIVDDVLDVDAASDALGKTAGKDAVAGKPTYPALFGLEPSKGIAAACLARAEAALAAAGLSDSHLAGLARAIVNRRS